MSDRRFFLRSSAGFIVLFLMVFYGNIAAVELGLMLRPIALPGSSFSWLTSTAFVLLFFSFWGVITGLCATLLRKLSRWIGSW